LTVVFSLFAYLTTLLYREYKDAGAGIVLLVYATRATIAGRGGHNQDSQDSVVILID
jgi:hypothetical protein